MSALQPYGYCNLLQMALCIVPLNSEMEENLGNSLSLCMSFLLSSRRFLLLVSKRQQDCLFGRQPLTKPQDEQQGCLRMSANFAECAN